MMNLYNRSSYNYELPAELIAQQPCQPRDSSRLLVVDRASGAIEEKPFRFLAELLQEGDSLVFNDTKVIPARFIGRRAPGGGAAEVFLARPLPDNSACWEAMVRPGKKMKVGSLIEINEELSFEVVELLPEGMYAVKVHTQLLVEEALEKFGRMPLPRYIRGGKASEQDAQDYQTLFAKHPGALAVPAAALHFTPELLQILHQKGVTSTTVTLHVGLGTFRPVTCDDIRDHAMHSERIIITPEAAHSLTTTPSTKISRQICVGTTCCRVLESACDPVTLQILPGSYDTAIFIYPGYQFKYVRSLLTNFHQPESSLIMLVSAFAGYDLAMQAYAKAIALRLRFLSYGDAMLIL